VKEFAAAVEMQVRYPNAMRYIFSSLRRLTEYAQTTVTRNVPAAALLALALALVLAIALNGIGKGELHLNYDETNHACNGLFVSSVIKDLPLAHPLDYAYRYYAQYPAISVGHYPPFFYLVEAGLFLTLGPSVITARVAVLAFMVLGVYFWFKFGAALLGKWAALAGSLLLTSLPGLLIYEKAVMLEVPSLALCIVATYFWHRYLSDERPSSLYLAALCVALALATKHNCVYLAPVFVLTALLSRKRHLLVGWPALWAAGIVTLIAGPPYFLMFFLQRDAIAAVVSSKWPGLADSSSPWTFYLTTLPASVGWPLLTLSTLGMATSRWWTTWDKARFMYVWLLSCFVVFSLVTHKEARYIVYWLPPFIFFAVGPCRAAAASRTFRAVGCILLTFVVGGYAGRALGYERPYVAGYEQLARYLIANCRSGMLLTEVSFAPTLIFYLRALDSAQRFGVIRKALYVDRFKANLGHAELVTSQSELWAVLADYGVRYVVVETNMPLEFPSQRILYEQLDAGRFKLIFEAPIQTNISSRRGRCLRLYEYLDASPPSAEFYRVKMLSLSYDVVVPMSQLPH
jgi:4-amino-4-deoxy-L-arabinose transferase-like glycosyltransferase